MKKNMIKICYMVMLLFIVSCSNNDVQQNVLSESNVEESDIVKITPEQAKQITLAYDTLQIRSMSGTLKLNGQIEVPPQNLISVSVPLGGYLKASNLLPGTQVKKGQVLATLEDQQYIQLQQDYLITKSKMAFAAKEFERQKELNLSKANSDKVYQQAENEFKQLTIEAKGLAEKLRLVGLNPTQLNEQNITRTIHIYSPINGYVSKVNVNIGKYVTPADVLFELINPADIHLNLVVFEKDLAKIKIGQNVIAFTNSNPSKKYTTQVVLVNHALNEDRSAEIHCHFDKYDKQLVPGMYMSAEVQVVDLKGAALPKDAVVNFENKDYVFEVIDELTFRLLPVEKGDTIDGFTVINSNLSGKKIVTQGAYSLLMKLKNTSEE